MSLAGIKAAIVTALDTISGLRAYDQAPESVNDLPCAYVLPKSGAFHFDAGNNMTHELEIILLVQRGGELQQAQADIDAYMDSTGTKSVKAVLESSALVKGTDIQDLIVTGYRDYGGLEYAGSVFLGLKFDVHVLA